MELHDNAVKTVTFVASSSMFPLCVNYPVCMKQCNKKELGRFFSMPLKLLLNAADDHPTLDQKLIVTPSYGVLGLCSHVRYQNRTSMPWKVPTEKINRNKTKTGWA